MIGDMKMIDDRVLVKPDTDKEKTDSGIHIPDSVKDAQPTQQAEVVLVGDTVTKKIKKGAKVLYLRHSGVEIELEGKPYRILRYVDLLSIL
jgi:co-chaperonin GroES (HSP10)